MNNDILETVDKALRILLLLAEDSREMSISEVSSKTGINKSTTYRILNTFYKSRFISKNASNRKYRIGLRCLEIGSRVLKSLDLRNIARPLLERLRDQTGETVNMITLDGGMGVYIDRVESQHAVQMISSIGTREELHCTGVGKALLAFLPENEINEVIRQHGLPPKTARTITDPRKLKDHLREIRRQGYSIDNEESEKGIRCVGAPVFDHNDNVIASISVAALAHRWSMSAAKRNAKFVVETARRLSAALGNTVTGKSKADEATQADLSADG
jgi:IclR family KDG regulon transcriptional repressor